MLVATVWSTGGAFTTGGKADGQAVAAALPNWAIKGLPGLTTKLSPEAGGVKKRKSCVASSPKMEQLHCNIPTGRIS